MGRYVITRPDGSIDRAWGARTIWANIKQNSVGFVDPSWDNMATMRHYEQLYTTENVQFGYGVLYADGATETQEDVDMAYGYYRRDPDRAKKGMRGVFVYYYDSDESDNTFTGRNIFFPIGRSGYGHRKHGGGTKEGTEGRGILRYCCSGYNNRGNLFNKTAPLFAALYYRPGGIYYAKTIVPKCLDATRKVYDEATISPSEVGRGDKYYAAGMDLNYFSFDANMITKNDLGKGEDACMVRFVGTDSAPVKRKSKTRRR